MKPYKMSMMKEARAAKVARYEFQKASEDDRNRALQAIAKNIEQDSQQILAANSQDVDAATSTQTSSALLDRLTLDQSRIDLLVQTALNIASQPQVVGEITETIRRPDGLLIQKQRIPLGVIGMIFESRPNVIVDCSCLAIKSGNCMILKGGKEAEKTNGALTSSVRRAIQEFIPADVVQRISSRDAVSELLDQVGLVDVIIPRGGPALIHHVYQHSKIPVIAHFKGLCHLFIDQSANLDSALSIALNAKVQRPGVCNAMETLLLHKNLPNLFIQGLLDTFVSHGTEIRVCAQTPVGTKELKQCTAADWETEYLENILSIKTVENIDEAITHIQQYGSQHSEAICSQDQSNILKFQEQVDASSIMVNASTRFNDGSQYGLGAELGISTTKLHAYGPMGAKEMTTQRFLVTGDGHIRR